MKYFYKFILVLSIVLFWEGGLGFAQQRTKDNKKQEKSLEMLTKDVKPYSYLSQKQQRPDNAKLFDDFDSYEDFSLEFGDWVLVDVDQDVTYSYGIDFPHEEEKVAYMVMNPLQTDPPATFWEPHSGEKFLVTLSCYNKVNDDWLISPVISAEETDVLSFWAKSQSSGYGLERFQVLISTTGSTDPDDFTKITEGEYIKAPATEWTKYQYDLEDYAGQDIRFAIRCVSAYATFLMIDDVMVAPVPEEPSCDLNFREWDADTIRVGNTVSTGDVFRITNNEGGNLVINEVTDLTGTNFSTTFNPDEVNIPRHGTYDFGFSYHPEHEGRDSVAFVMQTNSWDGENDTIYLVGNGYYLPEGTIEIGKSKDKDVTFPIANYYNYSFSQSIYTKEELLDGDDKILDKIQLRYDGADPSYNHFRVFLTYTDKDEFVDKNDWETLTEADIYYDNMVALDAENRWITLNLKKPFVYDGDKNLVVSLQELSDYSVLYRGDTENAFYSSPSLSQNGVDNLNMGITVFKDSKKIDPYNLPQAFELRKARPNIRLFFNDNEGPKLMVGPEDLRFSFIPSGTTATHMIDVYNSGNDPLTVSDVNNNGLPLTVAENNFQLAAGESKRIEVIYAPITEGPFIGELTFVTNGGESSIQVYAEAYKNGYLYEDFESTSVFNFPPEGWSIKGVNGNWELGTYAVNAYDKQKFAFSDPGSDYIITPQLLVRPGDQLSFYAKGLGIPFADHALEVFWSTDLVDWHSFPVVELHSSFLNKYKKFTFDFPETAEGLVYVAFQRIGDLGEIYFDRVMGPQIFRHGNDLKLMKLEGAELSVVNEENVYSATVTNAGDNAIATYKLQLIDQNDVVLTEVDGPTVAPFNEQIVEIKWTPSSTAVTSVRAKIVCDTDENEDNDISEELPQYLQKQYSSVAYSCDGMEGGNSPVSPAENISVSQTILLKEDLGQGGELSGLAFKNNFVAQFYEKRTLVYISETDKEDLKDGWVPVSEQTLVFDKRLDFPQGVNTIFVPFNENVLYTGKNLVLTIYKVVDEETLFPDSKFFGIWDKIHPSRSRFYRGNGTGFDIQNLPMDNNYENFVPYTRVVFDQENCGRLFGDVEIVDAPSISIENISLRIPELDMEVFSDVEGNFELPLLPAGSHEMIVTSVGTVDKTINVDITAQEDLELNVELSARTLVDLSAVLHPSYDTDLFVEGAQVSLSNEKLNYNYTTNTAGEILFENILGGYTYELKIEKEGFDNYTQILNVEGVNLDLGDLTLVESAYPAILPLGTKDGSANMHIEWFAPQSLPITEFRKDDGIARHHLGYFEKPHSLAGVAYQEKAYVDKVKFVLQNGGIAHETASIFIFGLTEDGRPDRNNLLYQSQVFEVVDDVWNEHILPDAIYAPEGFYVGVNTGYLTINLAGDDGVGEPYEVQPNTMFSISDWTDESIEWSELGIPEHFPYNFLLRAEGFAVPESKSAAKGLLGYSVKRGLVGDEANANEWTTLNTSLLANTEFIDNTWNALAQGVYKYAVFAHYDNNVVSAPAFSNELQKDMLSDFNLTVNVTSEEDTPEGTFVSLIHNDGNIHHQYKNTIENTAGTIEFEQIWKGNYTLRVEKPNFGLYEEPFTIDQNAVSFTVSLDELINMPFGIEVESAADYKANVSWMDIDAPMNVFFEDLQGFTNDFENWKSLDIDQGNTYQITVCDFPGEGQPAGFKVFAPNETDPPIFLYVPEFAPYKGAKYAISFSGPDKTNDDWLISPSFVAGTGSVFAFHAKSADTRYGKDRFRVLISTSDDQPNDFTALHEEDYLEVGSYYEGFEFDLSKYGGQKIYVAIQCISDHAIAFCVDNLYIGMKSDMLTKQREVKSYKVYLNDMATPIATDVAEKSYTLSGLVHNQEYTVGVSKLFTSGESELEKKTFVYKVSENVAPVITSEPLDLTALNQEYNYELLVDDYNGDELSYNLVEGPNFLELLQEADKFFLRGVPATEGEYAVKWSVSDGVYTTEQSYTLKVVKNVGMDDFDGQLGTIYPNPSNGGFTIQNAEGARYEISNIEGRIVDGGLVENNSHQIDLKLKAGNYVIKLIFTDTIKTQKLIIQ